MKLKLLFTIFIVLGLSMAVIAQDDFPEDMLEEGEIEVSDPELIMEVEFDDEDDWEFYEDNTGTVQVDEDDEVYVIEVESDEDRGFLWGQDTRVLGDIVIQIETEQLSSEDNNGYGVMCRANPANDGTGYFFYISGDGFAAIYVVDEDGDESLAEWEQNDAINQGEDENELVVVCVDDYLGFYVNGELVAETYDDTFSEGVIGLAASIFEPDEDIEITFDNLLVWEVVSDGASRSSTGGRNDTGDSSSSDEVDEDLEEDIQDQLEDGDIEIDLDDVVLVETWDERGEWDDIDEDEFTIEVDDDTYVITNERVGSLVWGVNRTEHDDVVMHVEIEHLTDADDNGFGLMCRVNPDNFSDGYSFLVRPEGSYSIGYWEDFVFYSLASDEFDWVLNDDIDEGDDEYTMTIVCVDEYLALYIDGELIGELEDDTFDEGYAGVAAISFDGDVEVAFDNLVIWEASD